MQRRGQLLARLPSRLFIYKLGPAHSTELCENLGRMVSSVEHIGTYELTTLKKKRLIRPYPSVTSPARTSFVGSSQWVSL